MFKHVRWISSLTLTVAALLLLAAGAQAQTPEGTVIPLALSRQELADLLAFLKATRSGA